MEAWKYGRGLRRYLRSLGREGASAKVDGVVRVVVLVWEACLRSALVALIRALGWVTMQVDQRFLFWHAVDSVMLHFSHRKVPMTQER